MVDMVTGTPGQSGGPNIGDLFQPGLVPSSNTNSSSNSSSQSNAYSGMPEWFNKDLLSNLLPQLKKSFGDLPVLRS